jgi:hypothetical protein
MRNIERFRERERERGRKYREVRKKYFLKCLRQRQREREYRGDIERR